MIRRDDCGTSGAGGFPEWRNTADRDIRVAIERKQRPAARERSVAGCSQPARGRGSRLAQRQSAVVGGHRAVGQHGEIPLPQTITDRFEERAVLKHAAGERDRVHVVAVRKVTGKVAQCLGQPVVEPGCHDGGFRSRRRPSS